MVVRPSGEEMYAFRAFADLRYRTYDEWIVTRLLVDAELRLGPAGMSADVLVMGLGRAMFLTKPDGNFGKDPIF